MKKPCTKSVDLAYEEHGPADAPSLLFIHGWTSDRSSFRKQIAFFCTHYRCVALDLPGHGESCCEDDADFSIDYYRDVLKGFIEKHNMQDASLIGHSLGAILALELIAQDKANHPNAILVDPAPMIQTGPMRASLRKTRQMLRELGREATQAILTDKVFFRKSDPTWLGDEIRQIAQKTRDVAALRTWDTIMHYDGGAALERVIRPICFINSDRPQNRESDIRTHAPKVYWGRTVGTGHFNHLVMPQQVNAMIADFLDLTRRLPG